MFDANIDSETLLYFEISIQLAIILSISLWVIFFRVPIKLIVLALSITLFIVGAFRLENYNSDTLNYASYFHFLSLTSGSAAYSLSKIEPIHIFLLLFSSNFTQWLFLEGVCASLLTFFLYRKVARTDVFITIMAFAITLYTSSFRFSFAILLLCALLTHKSRNYAYLLLVSILSAAAHISMLFGGILAKRRFYVPILLVMLFFMVALFDSDIRQRSGVDLQDVKTMGLKSLTGALLILSYAAYSKGKTISRRFFADFVNIIMIFLTTAFVFPILNRLIIIFSLVIIMEFSLDKPEKYINLPGRIYSLIFFLIISVPFIYFTPDLFYRSVW